MFDVLVFGDWDSNGVGVWLENVLVCFQSHVLVSLFDEEKSRMSFHVVKMSNHYKQTWKYFRSHISYNRESKSILQIHKMNKRPCNRINYWQLPLILKQCRYTLYEHISRKNSFQPLKGGISRVHEYQCNKDEVDEERLHILD